MNRFKVICRENAIYEQSTICSGAQPDRFYEGDYLNIQDVFYKVLEVHIYLLKNSNNYVYIVDQIS